MQGTWVFDTGCRGARLLVWLIRNDHVQPLFITGVCTARSARAHEGGGAGHRRRQHAGVFVCAPSLHWAWPLGEFD